MAAPGPSIPAFCARSRSRIFFRGSSVPVASLADRATEIAKALTSRGICFGDRVALWLPNCPEWFAIFLATARIGAIAVMVNTRFRSSEIADIIGRSGSKALFLSLDFCGIDFPKILSEIELSALESLEAIVAVNQMDASGSAVASPTCQKVVESMAVFLEGSRHVLPASWPDEADLAEAGAAIFTTSGTTSNPKFVLHSQQNATRHAADVIRAFDMGPKSGPIYQALPLCGVFGFCITFAAFAADQDILLEEAFSASAAVAAVQKNRSTHLFATDDMLHRMLDEDPDKEALRSLKMVGFAAFNGDPAVLMTRCEDHRVPLFGLYGMSEVMALFAAQFPEAPSSRRMKGGGMPVCSEAAVRVRDPETGELLGPREIGALEIKTPNRMIEYFGNPEATSEAIDGDGFLRTGDVGYLEDVGFVFTARMGDALRLGGFLVAPEEISSRIDALTEVSASQVVGVLVAGKSRCAAFVIPTEGADIAKEAVVEHCRSGLASYKVPVAVWEIDAFPTTPGPNGTKILRRKLQDLAQQRLDAEGDVSN